MKIGFPRAVHYYDYFPFWAGFFRGLDLELVTSPLTNRKIMESGLKKASDETCLPIKLLAGHIQALKDVDALFLPRMVSMEEKTYLCPKLLGLPESILPAVPENMPVLTVTVNWRKGKRHVLAELERFGDSLGKGRGEVRQAFVLGKKWLARYETARLQGLSFIESMGAFDVSLAAANGRTGWKKESRAQLKAQNQALPEEEIPAGDERPLTIALIGHSYLTQETYASLNLLSRLQSKARVRLIEEVEPAKIAEGLQGLRKALFWSQAKKVLGAGSTFSQEDEVDGLIYLSCFGCGTDSITQDLVARIARGRHKPYMVLTLDEHSGEAGLVTRLEAFLDMTERRAQDESNLSSHG